MPTELSEDQARNLLARAAATVGVDETAPMTLTGLPEPRHRRWSVVAAAAGVVLVVGGGYLMAERVRDDPAPSAARDRDRARVVVHDDRVPGLIGYTEGEATARLRARGLEVQVRHQADGCNVPGIVTGSTPPAGTSVRPGDTVTVRVVAERQVGDCVGEVPWDAVWAVVRSARGVDLSFTVDRVPDQVLDTIERMLDVTAEQGSPFVAARWTSADDRCWPETGRRAVRFWVEVPADGQFCPPTSVVFEIGIDSIINVRVEGPLAEEQVLDEGLARFSIAEQFAAWARGDGPPPAFAERVRLLQGGTHPFGTATWLRDPTDPLQYSMCSGRAPGDCPIDPIFQLDHYDGSVVPAQGRARCVRGTADLPPYLADRAAADLVRLTVPEPRTCEEDLPVELWIGDEGLIYAVNLAGAPGT